MRSRSTARRVARIANGKSVSLSVEPGQHVVRITQSNRQSADVQLDLERSGSVRLGCRNAGTTLMKFFFGKYRPRSNLDLSQAYDATSA